MALALHCSISAVIALVNASGVYFLRLTSKHGACNQMMILGSLSLCNIMLSIFWTTEALFNHFKATETIYFYRWFPFIAGQYIIWYSMIITLTVDRFMGCNFPIQHKIFVRRKFILRTIGSCWIVGLTLAVIGCCVGYKRLRITLIKHFWPFLDMFCLALFVGTYGSIFVVMVRRRFNAQKQRSSDHSQFVLVVTTLLVCFLALEAIPSIVHAFAKFHTKTFKNAVPIMYKINLLCDPLIYIFLQRKVRRVAKEKLRSFYALLFFEEASQVYHIDKENGSSSLPKEEVRSM